MVLLEQDIHSDYIQTLLDFRPQTRHTNTAPNPSIQTLDNIDNYSNLIALSQLLPNIELQSALN